MTTVAGCLARAAAATPAGLPGADDLPRWAAAVEVAAEVIAALRDSIRRDPPDRFVERLRSLWLAEVTASARYLGRFRRARLERFFTELEAALVTPDGSLATVARFLRRAVEEGRDSQLPAAPDVAADAVHVLTIHGAKGLDFEHVYLIQIHKETGGGRAGVELEVRREPGSLEYRLFGWPTPAFEAAEARRAAQARAEQVRLLYVAMTRAKRRLVLSGRWRSDGVRREAGVAASLADLVGHRLDSEAMGAQARGLQRARLEPDCPVQWSVLGVDAPDLSGFVGDGGRRELDSERVVAEAGRLAGLWELAAARSAMRATAAVTAVVHEADAVDAVAGGGEGGGSAPREAALAVGTAVHRLLERLDPTGPLPEQLRAAAGWLDGVLVRELAPAAVPAARALLRSLMTAIQAGICLARLGELGERIVARELPLVLPPEPGDPVVGALVGTADLVYRDGSDFVVADYKTDAISSERQLDASLERYRPQLERYAGALRSALGLDQLPATELWFLAADRIVRLRSPAKD
jgi:ATP-dependent helicase/nuclease subunit A